MNEIINAFADQKEQFTTAELHDAIKKRVLPSIAVKIVGTLGQPTPTQIAGFLYEIGFLTAREELENGKYRHYAFSDNPALLHSRTNPDRGMTWEIHPVFRQALGLRTAEGKEAVRLKGKRR